MKRTSIIKALTLALPVSLLTAADTAVLLLANAATTVGDVIEGKGGAKAIIKEVNGETRLTADAITFDESKNALICRGDATISSGGRVVKGKDITLELGERTLRVSVLPSDRLLLLGEKPVFESFPIGIQYAPSFTDRLPSANLDIKKRSRL